MIELIFGVQSLLTTVSWLIFYLKITFLNKSYLQKLLCSHVLKLFRSTVKTLATSRKVATIPEQSKDLKQSVRLQII